MSSAAVVCDYCGLAHASIRTTSLVDGSSRLEAPVHVRILGPLSAEHADFCDELCLLRWCVDRREATLERWRRNATDRIAPQERPRRWWRG